MSESSKRMGPTAAGTARTAIAAFAGRLRDRIGRAGPREDRPEAQLPDEQDVTPSDSAEGEPDQHHPASSVSDQGGPKRPVR